MLTLLEAIQILLLLCVLRPCSDEDILSHPDRVGGIRGIQ